MRSRSKRTPLKYISMTFHRNGGHSFDGEVSLGKQSSSSTHHFHESTCELLQKLKQVAPEASGTFMALPSPGVSLLTGLSLLFCLWLMLFSSFSRTRPRRENRGKCYLSLKMSSCSWYSVKSLWKRRFCPITGRSSFNSSLFRKPCTKTTKASSECITRSHKCIPQSCLRSMPFFLPREGCVFMFLLCLRDSQNKNCLHIYIHSWSWCSLCSYRLQTCSEKGRHLIGMSLFQSCCLKNVETWTCNPAPSAWYSRQHQSWDCGTKLLSTVSRETNPSALGGSLLMRLEQSMERVSGSAKIICDCFFTTKFNHILSSIVYPWSVIFMGNSSLFFVELLPGLTITVDSHWLPAE